MHTFFCWHWLVAYQLWLVYHSFLVLTKARNNTKQTQQPTTIQKICKDPQQPRTAQSNQERPRTIDNNLEWTKTFNNPATQYLRNIRQWLTHGIFSILLIRIRFLGLLKLWLHEKELSSTVYNCRIEMQDFRNYCGTNSSAIVCEWMIIEWICASKHSVKQHFINGSPLENLLWSLTNSQEKSQSETYPKWTHL